MLQVHIIMLVDLQVSNLVVIRLLELGTLTTSGGITFSDGTTQTSAGASTGFSIAMGVALG